MISTLLARDGCFILIDVITNSGVSGICGCREQSFSVSRKAVVTRSSYDTLQLQYVLRGHWDLFTVQLALTVLCLQPDEQRGRFLPSECIPVSIFSWASLNAEHATECFAYIISFNLCHNCWLASYFTDEDTEVWWYWKWFVRGHTVRKWQICFKPMSA